MKTTYTKEQMRLTTDGHVNLVNDKLNIVATTDRELQIPHIDRNVFLHPSTMGVADVIPSTGSVPSKVYFASVAVPESLTVDQDWNIIEVKW
jgi:hypothetical protein